MNANLAEILRCATIAHSDRPALLYQGEAITYGELWPRVASAAALLRHRGVRPGDRVAIRLPNSPAFVAAYFGALQLGAIVVPLNILLADPEVEQRMTASGATILLAREDELAEGEGQVSTVVERQAHDPAVILFTSGTSGKPKGAILTHGGLHAAAVNAAEALRFHPDDVILGAAPFSHVLGQSTGLVSTFLSGAAVAVIRRFDQERTLDLMAQTGTSVLLGVPTMCIALCEAARAAPRLPPLRIAHVGGAAVPLEVARDFERTFPGAEVYEGYGLTELSGIATTTELGRTRKPGSVGVPLGDTELRIVSPAGEELAAQDVGEVQLRGSSVTPGYWNDPAATSEALTSDGWLSTGDLGYVDTDGYLFLVDRKKDLIIRGGYNVYPREVEEVLYAHPDVLEAAVVGVRHPTLGEEVAAFLVLRPGARLDADAVREYTRSQVAAYKYPRHVVFVADLPRGPTGKILKRALDAGALIMREEQR